MKKQEMIFKYGTWEDGWTVMLFASFGNIGERETLKDKVDLLRYPNIVVQEFIMQWI